MLFKNIVRPIPRSVVNEQDLKCPVWPVFFRHRVNDRDSAFQKRGNTVLFNLDRDNEAEKNGRLLSADFLAIMPG